jgi:hypothetical protein
VQIFFMMDDPESEFGDVVGSGAGDASRLPGPRRRELAFSAGAQWLRVVCQSQNGSATSGQGRFARTALRAAR